MDRASAEALHEKASQHYLNGEFAQALAAWESLLRLDPADERAIEGTRLSRMLIAPDEAAAAEGAPAETPMFEIDHELLGVAATRGATAARAPRAAASLPDPSRQSEGIDFGDVASVEPLPLAAKAEEDAIDAALAHLGVPGMDERAPADPAPHPPSLDDLLALDLEESAEPAEDAPPEDESALAPFRAAPAASAAPRAVPPAEGELSRRLSELLTQAGAAADAGQNDEAKALLARIAVLDEDNAVAAALAERLRETESEGLRQIDDWIVEGVQWFEQGRIDEARGNFSRVLEAMPDHIEARDYLRRIEETEAARSVPPVPAPAAAPGPHVDEDFLASLGQKSAEPASIQAVPLAAPSPRSRPVPAPAPVADPAPRPRRRLSPVLLIVVLTGAAAGGWFFLGPEEAGSDIPAAALAPDPPASSTPAPRPPVPAAAQPANGAPPADATPPPQAAPTGDPRTRAVQATAKGDWPAAILAYNEILAAHPADAEARAGLLEAGQRYRDQKALDTQILQARRAFEDGEFEAGLRLLYRMPKGVDTRIVEGGKVAGWVNLGIVDLKAGDPGEALTRLDEALALRPDDPQVRSLHAFAQDYTRKAKDPGYYTRVEALAFQPLPD